MIILVIGSGGFIGRHISAWLEGVGHEVVRVDIQEDREHSCVVVDQNNLDYTGILDARQVEVCINCSGAASVPASFADPKRDFELNTRLVAGILDSIREVSKRIKFIHLSSAAVYGNPVVSPVCESSEPKPVSPYGWHKLQAEVICREHWCLYGIGSLSLRVFSAYGPGLRKQLFWDLYQKGLSGAHVQLYGTGEETRDFIYVEDIAKCVDLLLTKGEFDGRSVNVGMGESVKVRDAANDLYAALQWDRQIHFSGDGRVGDPLFWRADVSYLKSLGFTPNYAIDTGLAKVAEWLKGID